MKGIQVHTSPLSGIIYAGVPLKNGTWAKNKNDVTILALVAVAEHVNNFGEDVIISKPDGTPEYKISVEKLG